MKSKKHNRNGFILIASLIFIVVFGALAAALVSISTANVRIPSNQHEGNKALANAMSGLEFMRNVLTAGTDIKWPDRIEGVKPKLESKLESLGMADIDVCNVDASTLAIEQIDLDSSGTQSFTTQLKLIPANLPSEPNDILQITVTGKNGDTERMVRVNYEFQDGGHSVFNYGVATKGPLSMVGQADITGTEVDVNALRVQAGVYIEGVPGESGVDSFSITNNASVAGDVSIYDPCASYYIGNKAVVGGADAGSDERVFPGVDFIEFPVPEPEYFEQFATGDVIDSNNKSTYSTHSVFENVVLEANTDFTFASKTEIKGVLYIKSPNKVNFAGQLIVTGLIVCEGDYENPISGDSLTFSGQVICMDTSTLVGEEYDGIKDETGTFLLAPGFETDFSGQANFINGAIAASGVSFSGQAGGTINGSIINYSRDVMDIAGQSQLIFNRTGMEECPAGFMPYSQLRYIPQSYTELSDM